MKRLLLVSMISLLPASAYGMNTPYRIMNATNESIVQKAILALQQQIHDRNQNNKKIDYELAQLVTEKQKTLDLHNTTIVKYVPTITRPQHNHRAILGTKRLFSINNAKKIKAMSNGSITITPLVKNQPTRPLSAVLTTPSKPLPLKKRSIFTTTKK